MDYGDLEQRPGGQETLRDLADEGDVVDDLRGHTSAHVAENHRVAESQPEEVRGVGARVETRDDEQAKVRKHNCAFMTARGGEGAIALECRIDIRRGARHR